MIAFEHSDFGEYTICTVENAPKVPMIIPMVVHFIAPTSSKTPLDKIQPIKAKIATNSFLQSEFFFE